jgi:hypothetical protein
MTAAAALLKWVRDNAGKRDETVKKALMWLLCAVMLAGAVACTGEKSASGQNRRAAKRSREKGCNPRKGQEKAVPVAEFATDNVVVENNALSDGFKLPKGLTDYGAAAASWNQYAVDHNLTQEQTQEGLNRIATGEGPSWGTEYKVKPNGKVEVSGGVGLALKGGAEVNNDYISISTGYTKEFGVKAGASVGIDFGPYFPGVFGDLNRDYSTSIGFGPGSVGMSGGKDGIGFSFSVGPSIGFTGSTTGSHDEKIDLNGDSTKKYTTMISNDIILNASSFMLLLLLLLWECVFLFLFIEILAALR